MQSCSSASSCTAMHLARTVEIINGCKEAIWEEYEKLYPPDYMPAVTRTARPATAAVLSTKASARENFEEEWTRWEKLVQLPFLITHADTNCSDMTDRIGMRGFMLSSLAWPEPPELPKERHDRLAWRSWLDRALSSEGRDSGSSISVFKGQSDIYRSISGFVGYKV